MMKFSRKKIYILLAALLVCIFMAACGAEAEPENVWIGIGPGSDLTAITERTEYYDLTVKQENLFDLGLWERNPEQYTLTYLYIEGGKLYALLGTQFAAGEPAQIWSEISSKGADIYLYRTDGSRELLLRGISSDYASSESRFKCYMDRDGNCYFYHTDYLQIKGEYKYGCTLMKMLPSGKILYTNTLDSESVIEDICQMEDGRIYLLLADYSDLYHYSSSKKVLAELDPDIGMPVAESRMELLSGSVLGAAGGSPALAGYNGIESVDMAAQSTSPLLFFDGTSYGWHSDLQLQDFRVLEDGSIEFLWTDKSGLNCLRERLRMEKVEKTPIVMRGIFWGDNTWLMKQIELFNRGTSDYHVIMETCGYGNDVEDFARLTSVQVGAGKGPDILCGDSLLHGYLGGMMDKGAFEALNPYMEASGIREEDYFPLAFSTWRQGETVYGVTPKMEVYCEEMDVDVLGSREIPDIESLADALLAREGNGVYRKGLDSAQVLNALLQGSESLWGMVDWEAGVCSFNTPLFGKLLETAGRYGDDARKELEPEITKCVYLEIFFGFNSLAEQEEKGRVYSGILFDDGCHGVSLPLYTMAVNANSAHKEGAWEFISFLLGEEVQYMEKGYQPPVHRESFDKWLEWEIRNKSEVRFENGHAVYPIYYGENTSEEKREEYRKAIEDIRALPTRTAPILKIVMEEAADYFNGSKSAEEVSQVIDNRVQLYLDERK